MTIVLSVFGILFGLFLLILLVYKGLHLSWVSIFAALIIMVTSGIALGQGWTDNIGNGIAQLAGTLIPLFLAGATFGKLLSATGAANSFAHAIMSWTVKWPEKTRRKFAGFFIIALGILMAYAGVDNFAILFTQIAIAAGLMYEVNIPRRFICALIMLGSSTGGLLPGAASILNIFGGQFLGTPPTAAPVLSILGVVFIIVLSLIGLSRMWEKDIANGLKFEFGPLTKAEFDMDKQPPWFFMLFPIVTIFLCYNVGSLSAFFSLLIGLAVAIIFLFPYLPCETEKGKLIGRVTSLMNSFNGGAEIAGIPAIILINFALGNLISATPAFAWFAEKLGGVQGPPTMLFTFVAIITIGVSASMSGLIVMYNLANELFIPILGMDAVVIHRLVGFSGAVLDSVPFGSRVVVLLLLTGLKQKEGYPPIFFATVGVTFAACIFVSLLAMLGIR